MYGLYETTNYAWCDEELLGEGAAGKVYRAIHKGTGSFYAVKTFIRRIHQDIRMREFDILSRLDHQNIVSLLAIEEEKFSGNKVLVMELCAGGSLHDVLREPRNVYGLEETEYLRVQCHVAAGMKHLREQRIVHRDIKPGNIMRFIREDGESVYKLADFGAARELHPEQEFKSLWGTEEYLHPDIFNKAILRNPVESSFSAAVDLWSVGVTFYHVATGQLPFRPFGGRSSRETMYKITTEKESGVISGVQYETNGPIEWSRTLPETCCLSVGLQLLLTPLLAGLMEINPQLMWSFEQFFDEVEAITKKHVIHVFNISSISLSHVYLDPHSRSSSLAEMIASQTSVEVNDQLLLFDGKRLDTLDPEPHLLTTTPSCPVFLFTRIRCDKPSDVSIDIPELPNEMPGSSVEAAYRYSIDCCEIVYYMRRVVANNVHNNMLLWHAAKMLWTLLTAETRTLFLSLEKEEAVINEMKRRLVHLAESSYVNSDISHLLGRAPSGVFFANSHGQNAQDYIRSKLEVFHRLFVEVQQLKQCVELRLRCLTSDEKITTFVSKGPTSDVSERNILRMDQLISQIEAIRNEFKKERHREYLPRGKELFYTFKKQSVTQSTLKAQLFLRDSFLPNLNKAFQAFLTWYSLIEAVEDQLTILRTDFKRLCEKRQLFAEDLDKLQAKCHHHVTEFSNHKQSTNSNSPPASLTFMPSVVMTTKANVEPGSPTLDDRLSCLNTEDGFVLVIYNRDGEIVRDEGQLSSIVESFKKR